MVNQELAQIFNPFLTGRWNAERGNCGVIFSQAFSIRRLMSQFCGESGGQDLLFRRHLSEQLVAEKIELRSINSPVR